MCFFPLFFHRVLFAALLVDDEVFIKEVLKDD